MSIFLEARAFKQVEGGYVFQPPPSTIFHRTQAYRVTEAKKAEILAVIRSRTTSEVRAAMATALALAVIAGIAIDALGAPLWLSIFFGFGLFVIATIVGISLSFHLLRRRLQPILAGLPHSDEQLFPSPYRRRAESGATSRAAPLWFALAVAVLFAERLTQHPLLDSVAIVYLIVMVLSLFWVVATIFGFGRMGPKTASGSSDSADLTLERVAARLDRQEGFMLGLRWFVPGLLFAVLVLGALYVFQARLPFRADSITTGSVALRNGAGETVALLSTLPDGTPHLSLFDAQNKMRLSISLRASGGPSIALVDPDQQVRAVLSLNDQQDPSLTMLDTAKAPRGLLALDTGGSGTIMLSGPDGGLSLSARDGRLLWNPAGSAHDAPSPR